MLQPEELRKAIQETMVQCDCSAQQLPPCGRKMLQAKAKELRRRADLMDALARAIPEEITGAANLGLADLVMAGELR